MTRCPSSRENMNMKRRIEWFDNDGTKQYLRSCDMYKFFQVGSMRVKRRLLNILINYWNLDVEEFMLTRNYLTITIEDIYFITGLSKRGEIPKFQSQGGGWRIIDYINKYCVACTKMSSSQVSIKKITKLSLRVILYTLVQIMGSNSLY